MPNEAVIDAVDRDRIQVPLTAIARGQSSNVLLIDDVGTNLQTRRDLSVEVRRLIEQAAIPLDNSGVPIEEDLAESILDAAVRRIAA